MISENMAPILAHMVLLNISYSKIFLYLTNWKKIPILCPFMLRNYANLRTFFNPKNWLADENELFLCLV